MVTGHAGVFAVGDVAATDPLRSSARNRADKLLARNMRACSTGRPLRGYRPPRRRWGSVLGVQPDGSVFSPPAARSASRRGPSTRPGPWLVRRGIYRGIRRP